MSYFRVFVVVAALAVCADEAVAHGPPVRGEARPFHHTDEGFRNLPDSPPRFGDRSGGRLRAWGYFLPRMLRRIFNPPARPPSWLTMPRAAAVAALARSGDEDSVTWLGHAGFLLRLGGRAVLIDPFLGQRSSPVPWLLGPKRYRPPPIRVEDLPPIDVLVISHNHYEHLDAWTVDRLADKENVTVVVPLKLGDFFRERGYRRVVELDWWQSHELKGMTIHALPAVHWSQRALCDRNEVLWMSLAVEADGRTVYHSGDTGGHPWLFKRIGERLGRCDLGLLAIGAYTPRFIMQGSHWTPESALAGGREIGCGVAVGHHWGTLPLGGEPPTEPLRRFQRAASWYDDIRVWPMRVGETRALPPIEGGVPETPPAREDDERREEEIPFKEPADVG